MEILRRNTTKARRGKRFFTIVKVISWCKQAAAGQKRVDVVHLSDSPNNCVVLARPLPLSTAYKKPGKGSLADLGREGCLETFVKPMISLVLWIICLLGNLRGHMYSPASP